MLYYIAHCIGKPELFTPRSSSAFSSKRIKHSNPFNPETFFKLYTLQSKVTKPLFPERTSVPSNHKLIEGDRNTDTYLLWISVFRTKLFISMI